MKDPLLFTQARRLLRFTHALVSVFVLTASLALFGSETEFGNVGVLTKFPPSIHGKLEGVVQFTTGRTFVLSRHGEIEGSLLVPGSPRIRRNRGCSLFEVIEGTGSTEPSNYKLIFNRGSSVDTVVTRVDPCRSVRRFSQTLRRVFESLSLVMAAIHRTSVISGP